MNKHLLPSLGLLLAFLPARAAITVPGASNTDGELLVTTNTVIDLSQVVAAAWDSDNTAHAVKGVYDSNKWAVVFKYSRVQVDAGATVTFKNHPGRAPVVWLVDGDVEITGVVSLNGGDGVNPPNLAEPGPGGFRGGSGYYSGGFDSGPGFGVGGGNRSGAGGSYGTQSGGGQNQPPYGNPSLVPLIGGSGGAAHEGGYGTGAGAGGGAILIAASGEVVVTGLLAADGGHQQGFPAGAGRDGAIRIVANTLGGTGTLKALGSGGHQGPGGLGRIRLE